MLVISLSLWSWYLLHFWHVGPLLVFLIWIEPGDEYVNEEPVEYANEDQAFDNSENIAGKMTIPSISLLSLLASCSLYCYAALPTTCYILPPILPYQASNPPFLANYCLAMLLLLLSPCYSIASCRWRLEYVPCWNMFIVGISLLYLVYFNASIHLVKGGRLGLVPGVLFHSCRPSFSHTGVTFLDFAFLTQLGYNGNPLTVRIE